MRKTSAATAALLVLAGLPALTLGGATAASSAEGSTPPFVFTSDRDGDNEIYLRRADGTIVQLTHNRAPDYGAVWSRDGRRLAFVSSRDGDDEIFVMNVDGSGQRQLTRNSKAANGAPASDRAPAWSPDGSRIAFASTRDGGESEIYRMNADGTGQVRLTRTAAHVTDHAPSWSPGGHYIVFSSDRASVFNVEIYRMRMNGTEQVRMTRTAEGIDDNSPEYTPDGRRVVFSSTRSGGQHDLYTMAANSFDVRRLGGDPGLDDVFPKWTGDGRAVMFETFAREGVVEHQDIWTIRADGTGRTKLLGTSANESHVDAKP